MISRGVSLKRFVRIVSVLTRHGIAFALSTYLRRFAEGRRWSHIHSLSGPERLRMALEELGGAFIKFGQVMALQSDLLPLEYCRELFNLLDRVPPFSFAEVQRTFIQELGRHPCQIFDSFDPKPIATGSIGQVHIATLGRAVVAVKVRRPNVLADFGADIRLMSHVVRIVTGLKLRPLHWIVAPTSEFIGWTREEIDYRREARYMDAVGKNGRDNINEQVPRVLWHYTTECLLTTEYFDACTALDYMRARETRDSETLRKIDAANFVPEQYARNLIDNFLGDAFRYGVFHADLHPANLMIMPGSRVGYIDFGIAGVLSAHSRRHLIAMTLAYTRGDLSGMCECFYKVSAMEENASRKAFRNGLDSLSRGWYASEGGRMRMRKSITAMMLDLLKLSRSTGIWPQRDVVKYIRSAIALDGLIKSLAPGFDVGEHLEKVCEQQLHWQSLGGLLQTRVMLRLMHAGVHLGIDGANRAVGIVSVWNEAASRQQQYRARPQPWRATALHYSIFAIVCAASFNLFQKQFSAGLNVPSGILLVLVVSVILAIWEIGKIRSPRQRAG